MATERLPMRKVREILRVRRQQGLSVRESARALGVSVGVVSKTSVRAEKAGVRWSVAETLSASSTSPACARATSTRRRVRDVDLRNGVISVRHALSENEAVAPKSGHERVVPLWPRLAEVLTEALRDKLPAARVVLNQSHWRGSPRRDPAASG